MKHSLLLVAVVALVAFAAPAHSQYMFLDTDGNGICDANDILSPATSSVDVWLDTDTNGDSSPVVCNDDPNALMTINSYEFFLRATGSVTYGTWTDNMSFGTNLGDLAAGSDTYHGRFSLTVLAPGTYKLGTLLISGVSAGATLSIVSSSSLNAGTTSFGTSCSGLDFDNTYKLGSDWADVCGTASPTPVTSTTWGQIKNIYR